MSIRRFDHLNDMTYNNLRSLYTKISVSV